MPRALVMRSGWRARRTARALSHWNCVIDRALELQLEGDEAARKY